MGFLPNCRSNVAVQMEFHSANARSIGRLLQELDKCNLSVYF